MSAPSSSASLADWLSYLEVLHPKTIALGLDRVQEVRQRMGLAFKCPVIIVGGTNGKGSTVAMLERILHCASYRVGCYTSPHLLRFNERVRIGLREAGDRELVSAFAAVEAGRGSTLLTYFEFTTLAAMHLFIANEIGAAVLEIGLGGRLDAVNAFDPDCSVLTNVDLDHQDYLGTDREQIGFEKAGIFRASKPAICADPNPPASVLAKARELGSDLRLIGRDFGYTATAQQWDWWGKSGKRQGLAYPALRGAIQLGNASAVLAALEAVSEVLPVSMQEVRDGLASVTLAARFQVLPGLPVVILDVAHNPHAAAALAANLGSQGYFPRTFAVFGALNDKDVGAVARNLAQRIDVWHCGGLPGPRGTPGAKLAQTLSVAGIANVHTHKNITAAWQAARGEAADNDRIVVFGSFLTVTEVLQLLEDAAA